MTRWLVALGLAVVAVAAALGATYWRRAADRAALARVRTLARDVAGYPDRMQREQVELMAERDRLKQAHDSREADDLVEADLRAQPGWQALVTERTALTAAQRDRDALRQEHGARSRIGLLKQIIQRLEADLARLDAHGDGPRPPGEDG